MHLVHLRTVFTEYQNPSPKKLKLKNTPYFNKESFSTGYIVISKRKFEIIPCFCSDFQLSLNVMLTLRMVTYSLKHFWLKFESKDEHLF